MTPLLSTKNLGMNEVLIHIYDRIYAKKYKWTKKRQNII